MKLFCAFMGENVDAFSVNVDPTDAIGDIKTAIIDTVNTGVDPRDAYKIHLYLAKAGDTWLPAGDTTARTSSIKLDPTEIIEDVFGGDLGEDTIHVLVKIPDTLVRESERLMVMARKYAAMTEITERGAPNKRE